MRAIILGILVVWCSACGLRGPRPNGVAISSLRAQPEVGLATVDMKVARKDLLAAAAKGSPTNDIRLVEIFKGGSSETKLPEYRFFEIKPQSTYHLLGLRTADVLIAAHDFVIYEPQKFATYVTQYLPYMSDGSIEVRRNNQPLLFKYSIVE